MSARDVLSLLPFLTLAAASVGILLGTAVRRSHRAAFRTAAGGLLAAAATLPISASELPHRVSTLLTLDGYVLFFISLFLGAGLAVALLAARYLEHHAEPPEEFYALLVWLVLGASVLVASAHFASFLLGLELLSVALYALIAYTRSDGRPTEAGLKYLVLTAASTAFLVFGMALLYADTGLLEWEALASAVRGGDRGRTLWALPGLALMLVAVGFKLGAVPFHMWAPDVYEGAPAPVSASLATISKTAMLAFLIRHVPDSALQATRGGAIALSVLAAASMTVGNVLALRQSNVKRLLAYSSIAHVGYLLTALAAAEPSAGPAAVYYLAAYVATVLLAFGAVAFLSGRAGDADSFESYRSLFWRRPLLAAGLGTALLSLAGIPPTGGFLGKFFVLTAAIEGGAWFLALAFALNSGFAVYYYLRLAVALFQSPATGAERPVATSSWPEAALGILGVLVVWLGVHPRPLQSLIASLMR